MSGCVVGRSGKGVKAIATRSDAILNGAVKMPMTVEARMVTGRRRMDVKKLTDRLNAPIQGTAADGLKLVLALLWERRSECPGGRAGPRVPRRGCRRVRRRAGEGRKGLSGEGDG
jgi:hypothetical protein